MLCTRCGRREAFSEAQWTGFAEKGGPPPPPLPAGMCLPCACEDPDLRAQFRVWGNQVSVWGDQRTAEYVRRARELAVRPLEAIDRFVDSLR